MVFFKRISTKDLQELTNRHVHRRRFEAERGWSLGILENCSLLRQLLFSNLATVGRRVLWQRNWTNACGKCKKNQQRPTALKFVLILTKYEGSHLTNKIYFVLQQQKNIATVFNGDIIFRKGFSDKNYMSINPLSQVVFFHPFPRRRWGVVSTPSPP